jgi:hypothetical protein
MNGLVGQYDAKEIWAFSGGSLSSILFLAMKNLQV